MIYLNQAATTFPKPQSVYKAHTAALCALPSGQFRSSYGEQVDVFEACRRKLGELLEIKEYDRIWFSSGATDSANAVIYGLGLASSHVITTATEHNSVLRPLLNLKEEVRDVTILSCDKIGRINPSDIKAAVRPNTKAVFINHVSNVTGYVQNMNILAPIVKELGLLLIVDVSQSAGCIPIYTDKWKVDGLIFTGHKALFGSQGTGGYYIRKGIEFHPYRFGGTGFDSERIYYDEDFFEYEVGTANTPGFAGLLAGVEYVLNRGVKTIETKEQKTMTELYKSMEGIHKVILYGDAKAKMGPVLSFNIKGFNPGDVAYILQNGYDIVVRTGLHCAPLIHHYMGTKGKGTVRISISDLTTTKEINIFLEALIEICKSAPCT